MKHSATSPACQHALLAKSPVGHVSVCPDCEVVHLWLDCFSVRFEVTAFSELANMLSQAQKLLQSTQRYEHLCGDEQTAVVH